MEINNLWSRFQKSGKVTDYLYFVNNIKGGEEGGTNGKPLYNRSSCDKGNENRGE